MSNALDLTTIILLFGWVPFWWSVAIVTLYRMNKHDTPTDTPDPTTEVPSND